MSYRRVNEFNNDRVKHRARAKIIQFVRNDRVGSGSFVAELGLVLACNEQS